jgi:uncharacterized protein YcbX
LSPITIESLFRYPIKGLKGESLSGTALEAGQGLAFDRIYAIETGGGRFDPQNPKWLPKTNYLVLMRYERLASLTSAFDEKDHTLTLFRQGKQVAMGCLKTKLGRQIIEQFMAAFMKNELNGPPRIVSAEGHNFTDIAAKAVHLVNLETVRDLGRVLGQELNPLRFRANIYFSGVPAWEERKWVGKTIRCGAATLKVFDETGRCEATSVDPETAIRGPSLPAALERTWGHTELGLYAEVLSGGHVKPGDRIEIQD